MCILQKPVSSPTVKQLASWLNEADKATGLLEGSITGLVFMVGRGAEERGRSAEEEGSRVYDSEQTASTCASSQTDGSHGDVEAHDRVMSMSGRSSSGMRCLYMCKWRASPAAVEVRSSAVRSAVGVHSHLPVGPSGLPVQIPPY